VAKHRGTRKKCRSTGEGDKVSPSRSGGFGEWEVLGITAKFRDRKEGRRDRKERGSIGAIDMI